MSEPTTTTGTSATPSTGTAEAPQSALAAGAKTENVESMLSAAAKAAAAAPEAHDYGKLKADGVHADVLKVLREGFGEHKIAPEAAQKLLDKVLPAMSARREAEIKEQIAEADAAWQKELREDKDFGGEHYDRNTKLVEAAVTGLLTKEQAQAAKDSGLLGNPLFARFVIAAERIVAKATKQDTAAIGSQAGIVREDINDFSPAAVARSFGKI